MQLTNRQKDILTSLLTQEIRRTTTLTNEAQTALQGYLDEIRELTHLLYESYDNER